MVFSTFTKVPTLTAWIETGIGTNVQHIRVHALDY
jgi:hypothetical protein